jgi:hypothetical protein
MLPNILQGPSLLLHKSFLILGNAARCAPLKIPQNASEDDICVLFSHVVLSTGGRGGNSKLYQKVWQKSLHLQACHLLFGQCKTATPEGWQRSPIYVFFLSVHIFFCVCHLLGQFLHQQLFKLAIVGMQSQELSPNNWLHGTGWQELKPKLLGNFLKSTYIFSLPSA